MKPLRKHFLTAATVLMMTMLAGCASTQPLEPRELRYSASSEQTLRAAIELMIEQGYVVRHADLALGRADATLARWPEYRLQLQVSDVVGGSRISLSALRGNQPLPPYVLDPWLVELQHKLGELP
jgi:outer membrane murein-binding lipoprotein Lpp